MPNPHNMDPQQTLWDLIDAIDRNDREQVADALEALQQWNDKGGFLPRVQRMTSCTAFAVLHPSRHETTA